MTGPFDAVHAMINNRPQTPNNLQGFVSWLISIINAIIALIEQIGQANDARLTECEPEEVTDSHATMLEQSTAISTAATAAATTQWQQRDTTTSQQLPSRCNKCHA